MNTRQESTETKAATTTTREESAMKRDEAADKMEAQLKAWSKQLDDLVVSCIQAGAQANDPYRMRIDTLRGKLQDVEAKFDEFVQANPESTRSVWRAFQTDIKEDWNALKAELDAMTH